jgi:hypothetical protein
VTRRQALGWALAVAVLAAGIVTTVAVTVELEAGAYRARDQHGTSTVQVHIPGPRAPR